MNISDHPLFVWPFIAGMAFIFVWLPLTYGKWLRKTSAAEWKTLLSNIFTVKTLYAAREVIRECLLHRRIFRFNITLGYMHMSLAFGWFLLIAVGKAETMLFTHDGFNPPYLPVFFKYFYPNGVPTTFKGMFFLTIMDLLLMFVLSGLVLAVIKRFRSKMMGMKHTTKHVRADRIALTFLWFIFPLRWLAESVTAGIYGAGGFFTLGSGRALASFLPLENLFEPSWLAYSLALGGFFVVLPFSRYMHIFTEAVLIFLKHWGLKSYDRDNGYGDFEINACSRCGICTNVCQLADAGIHDSQAVYFVRDVRYDTLERETTENCLLCGRCTRACPVDIGLDQLRLLQRKLAVNALVKPYPWKEVFLPEEVLPRYEVSGREEEEMEVLYFAGCMSHLTPGIIQSTKAVLSKAGVRFSMLDEQGGICCGRPAMQAGFADQARAIIVKTEEMIRRSGASLLLVTCPICYKVFKEEYNLDLPVEHHTVYFRNLMRRKPELFTRSSLRMSYHDPCDLGRGSGIYDQPREVIRRIGKLVPAAEQRDDSLCCGGSLANLAITPTQRNMITDRAYNVLIANTPDYLVTSCPLCKKSFAAGKRDIPVIDMAEALNMAMTPAIAASPENVHVLTQTE